MSKKFRKVLAAVLAATMVLGSGVVANAADPEGRGAGKGDLVQVEHPDVFNVILPVDNGIQFNYILDPTGVIEKTQYEQFGGPSSASFTGTGNMWFENKKATDSDPRKFTNESDPATAYNKSNVDVEIRVVANLATPSGIVIATNSAAVNATATPSMYLEMKATESNGGTRNDAITVAKVTATSSIASASNAYETRYVNGKYVNQLDATASQLTPDDAAFGTHFKSYSFVLTGGCNANGDWKQVTNDPPKVTLVWTISKPDGAVEVGSYTDTTAHGNWSGSTLWLAKDANTGFSTTGLKVEVSDGGTNYNTLTADKYEVSSSGWVGVTWDNIAAGIGSTPTNVYVRVTDGTTRYVYED